MSTPGRPVKGLTERVLLRLTDEEKWMAQSLADEFDCSLNDALRVCVRRGFARTEPGGDIDAPVLDPNWTPRDTLPRKSVPAIEGQESIPMDDTTEDNA